MPAGIEAEVTPSSTVLVQRDWGTCGSNELAAVDESSEIDDWELGPLSTQSLQLLEWAPVGL